MIFFTSPLSSKKRGLQKICYVPHMNDVMLRGRQRRASRQAIQTRFQARASSGILFSGSKFGDKTSTLLFFDSTRLKVYHLIDFFALRAANFHVGGINQL